MPAEEIVTAPSIQIQHGSLAYGEEQVFANLNLVLPAGKWVSLLGPSGVGKSSLLRMICGLTTPQETTGGSIKADNGTPVQQQIAYMAQTDLLLPWMTVLDNATLGITLRGSSRRQYASELDKARELLDKAGLHQASHLYPRQLSGGMRQRVALVRTLMENKPVVLMDEPFSALDAITRYKLQHLAAELLKNKTVFFITHDPTEALRLSNDIYIMQGRPAVLKSVPSLTTTAPRDLTDKEVINLQALLFQQLSQAAGEAA
jgi:putative hydroxymethylpyrimidine transport system ATP-binding protein